MTSAILIAHGSPADPEPQERAMQALAARVRLWLPGWQIRGTTLACPGALEAATKALADGTEYFAAERMNRGIRQALAGRTLDQV